MSIETKLHELPDSLETLISCKMSQAITPAMDHAILAQVCSAIAERYVAENYVQIVSKFDNNAIVNLALTEAAHKIAAAIQPVVKEEKSRWK